MVWISHYYHVVSGVLTERFTITVAILCFKLCVVSQKNCVQAFSTVNLCIQEGSTLNYECTVIDSRAFGSTIWQGDAFECSQCSNQISLAHSQYESGVSGDCGNISAVSVGVSGSEYTSRLIINGLTLNKTTVINCTLSGAVLVESVHVKAGGMLKL